MAKQKQGGNSESQRRRRSAPAAKPSLDPRARFALSLYQRVKANGPFTRPTDGPATFRAQLVHDIEAVLTVPEAGVARADLRRLIARVDGNGKEPTAMARLPTGVRAAAANITAFRNMSLFLVGLDELPERLGVATTANAFRRLFAVAGDHGIPFEFRAAIAANLIMLCPWASIVVPDYDTEDLVIAFYRYFNVHKTIEKLVEDEAKGQRVRWSAVTEEAAVRVTSDETQDRPRLTPAESRVLATIEAVLRAVFDDALSDLRFSEVTHAWLSAKASRKAAALPPVDVAREVVGAAFDLDGESVRQALRVHDVPRGALSKVDPYAPVLARDVRAHPAFSKFIVTDWSAWEYLRRWLAFRHPPWRRRRPRKTPDVAMLMEAAERSMRPINPDRPQGMSRRKG